MAKPPCLNCEKRHAGCHASCELYLAFKKEIDALREEKYRGHDASDLLMRGALRTIKKNNRK